MVDDNGLAAQFGTRHTELRQPDPPTSAAILNTLTSRGLPADTGHPVLALAGRLADHHAAQWSAEDACRDRTADDHIIAATKRAIDSMNAQRVRLVEDLEEWAAEHVPAPVGTSLHTETFGSVIDRLAVAWVRSQRLGTAAADTDARDMARKALRQLAELAAAYDDLVRDVLAGRRRLPRWKTLKRYGGDQ